MEDSIIINNLSFSYEKKEIFNDLNLRFQKGGCYLIVGLNGCGKSTLLKLIGGKTICPYSSIQVLNKDPFRDTILNKDLSFLNNDWGTRTVAYSGYNMPLQSGLLVKEMMVKLKEQFPERNQELLEILNINPEWKLNEVSEGQRKRVQLYLGLIKPFQICLLDEITVNLDIIIKDRFMKYLKKESIQNNATILYVTHIFDGLDDWCSHLLYLKQGGKIGFFDKKPSSPIYNYLLELLKKEPYSRTEEAEQKRTEGTKNAGGYTAGILPEYYGKKKENND